MRTSSGWKLAGALLAVLVLSSIVGYFAMMRFIL